MDIDHLLKRGSETETGKSRYQLKVDQKTKSKEIEPEVIRLAQECGIEEIAERVSISTTSVAKYLARELKKNDDIRIGNLIDSTKINEIESVIRACNTTSITRILKMAAGKFSEAEIRLVKAQIEKNGENNWDY